MEVPDRFQDQFARMREEYLVLKEKAEQADRDNAPRFNILQPFRFNELWHSALLAELLNPHGSHGQGDHFLRRFMQHCLSRFGEGAGKVFSSEFDFSAAWKVTTERDVRPFGRLDIVIENAEYGVLIVIENKVAAPEGQHQMRNYGAWLAEHNETYPHQALLLLTPDGAESVSHGGIPYYRLSYRQDISGWLEAALTDVAAVRVSGTIAQYLDLIRREAVSDASGLQEFLRQPENLPTAVHVAQQIEQLRDKLHSRFWLAIEREMRHRLEDSSYADHWEIKPPKDKFRIAWNNCQIRPKSLLVDPKKPHATISLQQHKPQSANRLHYGIAWQVDKKHPVILSEYQALLQHLQQRKLSFRTEGWWIAGAGIGYSPRSDRFLLRMGLEEDAFIREIVDLPWNLFLDTVDLLAALNGATQRTEMTKFQS